jgi:hypothetical protein
MLNSRLWKQAQYEKLWNDAQNENDFATRAELQSLAQSKGNCRMISCPKKGDTASFVFKGEIVMRGVVESNGFEHGTAHQEHSCNDGAIRPHSINPEFAWIRITEVGLSETIRPTGQRTWAKMPV